MSQTSLFATASLGLALVVVVPGYARQFQQREKAIEA